MDRRGFLKGLVITAGIAAVPELWRPTKQIFLPPSGGWFGQRLLMREVQQYSINHDDILLRYDAAWIKPNGEIEQLYVLGARPIDYGTSQISIEDSRNHARRALEAEAWKRELTIPHPLELPRGAEHVAYV